MLTLYSYPALFGVADNNGYGLKVFAYLKLCRLNFRHQHIFNASKAPRGQLPYLTDQDQVIGDSASIVSYLNQKYQPSIDAGLDPRAHDLNLLVSRLLDDLYWVMSYSRWQDERYYPAFKAAFMREYPSLTEASLDGARAFNFQRYHFQGIGRYAPEAAYARGLADLGVLSNLIPAAGFVHGPQPGSVDAAIYGFIANIHFYDIDTPLQQFVSAQPKLVRHCLAIHERVMA